MAKSEYVEVALYDMEEVGDVRKINELLRSKNVHEFEHHVGFTPMGGCKILMFYRITDPGADIENPRENFSDGSP